jgi:hypothetical protein
MLGLIVRDGAAKAEAGTKVDAGRCYRQRRRRLQCLSNAHGLQDSQARGFDEIAADLFAGKDGTLDNGHTHTAPGQRPCHRGARWTASNDNHVIKVRNRHSKIPKRMRSEFQSKGGDVKSRVRIRQGRKRDRKRRAEPLIWALRGAELSYPYPSVGRSGFMSSARPTLEAARTAEFVEPDQSDSTSPVPFAKIFLFSLPPNDLQNFSHPGPREGRIMIVTDVGCGMRWTRQR